MVVVRGSVLSVSALSVFFQAEDGIRDLVRSRGLGDVYKRQTVGRRAGVSVATAVSGVAAEHRGGLGRGGSGVDSCLFYTSDAADERSSVDLGGRRIIKKKTIYESHSKQNKYYVHQRP